MAVNALVRNNSSNRNSFSARDNEETMCLQKLISIHLPPYSMRQEKRNTGKEKIRYTNPLNKTGNIKIPETNIKHGKPKEYVS